jgi:hypothetical protein
MSFHSVKDHVASHNGGGPVPVASPDRIGANRTNLVGSTRHELAWGDAAVGLSATNSPRRTTSPRRPSASRTGRSIASLLYASHSLSYLPRAGEQLGTLNLTNQALKPEPFTNCEVGARWDINPRLSAMVRRGNNMPVLSSNVVSPWNRYDVRPTLGNYMPRIGAAVGVINQ